MNRAAGNNPTSRRLAALLGLLLTVGCHNDMYDQPKLEPFERSTFFDDGLAMRPLVENTIARGQLYEQDAFTTGREEGELVATVPIEVDEPLLARGRQRYDIFCGVCHGTTGYGDGMIVRRGYRKPPSFHINRLREIPIGHFYEVTTQGYGVMPSYAAQIPVEDRWAIAAYVRVLQLSQYSPIDDVPVEEREKLETNPQP